MNSAATTLRCMGNGMTAAASVLTGSAPAAETFTTPVGAVGSRLTVVHQFGDDFHLVGISVSKTGRESASALTARVRNGLSTAAIDTKTGQVTPISDAAWNAIREEANGNPEWGLVQARWDDNSDHLWALVTGIVRGATPIAPKLVEFGLKTNQPICTYTLEDSVEINDALNDVHLNLPRPSRNTFEMTLNGIA